VPHQAKGSFKSRIDETELLDAGYGTLPDVAANLAEMARLNRWLGGYRALTHHLYPRLAACAQVGAAGPVTLLDLGTGSADLPVRLAGWAGRHGVDLHAWGLDQAPRHLSVAVRGIDSRPEVRLLRADAARLPFAPASADFVISSLFMHHFAPGELAAWLRDAAAVARVSLIMSDLVRSRAAYVAFRLLPPLVAGNCLTRHDGAVSIRRAYRPAELQAIARAAGLSQARVYVHWPWRMTLVVDK
jgi:hypothetical protein